MKNKERLKHYPLHESMRGYFGRALYKEMVKNPDIWIVMADLGYKLFDPHFEDFGDRVINCGASEQAGVGICVGLALQGKIPFFYSITNFSVYRPYEWLRNYLDYERINVKIIGAGRDDDYKEDGWTHQSPDVKQILDTLPNIQQFWPETKEEMDTIIHQVVTNGKPSFISLRR